MTCGSIEITGSNINSTGGYGGAGIGSGRGAQFESGASILIKDSDVKANGGGKGAGIVM